MGSMAISLLIVRILRGTVFTEKLSRTGFPSCRGPLCIPIHMKIIVHVRPWEGAEMWHALGMHVQPTEATPQTL